MKIKSKLQLRVHFRPTLASELQRLKRENNKIDATIMFNNDSNVE